jgi:hypothetical protein
MGDKARKATLFRANGHSSRKEGKFRHGDIIIIIIIIIITVA